MKIRRVLSILGAVACLFATGSASASPEADVVGTAFTYQGKLTDGGVPANGTYDLEFRLYNALSSGTQVGSTVTKEDVTVAIGLFTVQLDFGNVFDGTALYLEIAVRPGASTEAYTTLTPRQPLSASPYALFATQTANADQLDSQHAAYFQNASNINAGTLGSAYYSSYADLSADGYLGNAVNDLALNNSTLQSTLNADLLDGQHAGNAAGNIPLNNDIRSISLNADMLDGLHAGNAAGNAALNNGTLNTNLNADLLDGQTGSYYQNASNINAGTLGAGYFSAYADLSAEGYLGNAANDLALNNSTLNSNLNADMLDGYHAGNSTGNVALNNGALNATLIAQMAQDADRLDGYHASDLATSHNHWGQSWDGSGTGLTLSGGDTGVSGSGSTYGVYGSSSNNWGVMGTGPTGVKGTSTNGFGVHGVSSTGDGVHGEGNYGVHGRGSSGVVGASTVSGGYGIRGVASGGAGTNYAGYFDGNVQINGNQTVTGTKSAVVDTQDYGTRTLYSLESPENWFEDFGTGQLANGEAVIIIEPIFAETVNLTDDYHIFLTPLGDCALYVQEKSPTSFTVRAMGGQTCSIPFDYRIVAKRLGYEDLRLAEVDTTTTSEQPNK